MCHRYSFKAKLDSLFMHIFLVNKSVIVEAMLSNLSRGATTFRIHWRDAMIIYANVALNTMTGENQAS